MTRRILTAAALTTCFGLTCTRPEATGRASDRADARLAALFEDYWESRLRESPARATYLGDHRYDDRLEDYSPEARAAYLARRRNYLEVLRTIDRTAVGDPQRLNAEVFFRVLLDDLDAAELPDDLMPVRQQDGPHITLAMLRISQPMASADECRRYAARLAAFPAQVDQIIERMREGIDRGLVLPRIIVQKALPQVESQVVADARSSELYRVFADRHAATDDPVRVAVDDDMADAARAAIEGYARLRDFVRDQYMPACRDTVGLCHLPGGAAMYVRAARLHTTTALAPQEIHEIGLREVERIGGEMRAIMSEVGFEGTLAEFCNHLRSRADLHARSGEELMRRHREILRRSDALLPKLFGRLPRTPYELKEIESFRAPAAPVAYYYPAPETGSRPAYFYVNTYEPTKRPLYTMEALAYHEAMPGHHLQIALAQENRGLPAFRRHAEFTAFVEGWGLYSERLGFDLGGYRDPYSRFGRLTFDAWRACRLVVDTGMHALGWTRAAAIDFMRRHTALAEIDIENEIDRYIAWPGQALAYKIGELEIARLRAEAERDLGKRFDIRAFHDELLSAGAIPLDLLNDRMVAWRRRQSSIRS